MALNQVLAVVAVVCSVLLCTSRDSRSVAIAGVVAASLCLLLQLGIVAIRVDSARLALWVAATAIGVVILSRQTTRNGGALAGIMVFACAIPISRSLGLVG